VLRLVPPYVLTAEDTDSILNHLKTVLISMDTAS
jgi:acetylornithine/succinyldiaminopimelate/putrescine aminotransferase